MTTKIKLLLILPILLLGVLSVIPTPVNAQVSPTPANPYCDDGVLITLTPQTRSNYNLGTKCVQDIGFYTYAKIFIDQLIPLLLFAALILIIWSGVQYMTSGINTENQKAAKTRIVGIVIGVIFFVLWRLILNVVTPDITKELGWNAPSSHPYSSEYHA